MNNLGRKTILVVDDIPQNISLMVGILKDLFNIKVANSGPRALDILSSGALPDLVLLDVMMPGMDGHEVLRRMKADHRTQDLPVIFITAKSAKHDETRGLELGAVDYISKPVNPDLLIARISLHLRLKDAEQALRDRASFLEQEVQRRTADIRLFQEIIVRAMASLAETRDNETGNHIIRTQNYVRVLAQKLANDPKYNDQLGPEQIKQLYLSAPLHDIGKVGIPDHILLKPDKLSAEEFEIMKTHTTIGYESIVRAENASGIEVEFLKTAKEISLYHQEKWDGSGYPQGLKGEAIPLSARLMAIADVYDALISRRIYKEPYSHEVALEMMRGGAGSHFDPQIFSHFLEISESFHEIAMQYAD